MGFFVSNEKVTDRFGESRIKTTIHKERIVACIVVAVIALVLLLSSFTSVSTGYTGILTTFGRVENTTLEAGFHLKAPWQRVIKMDNREQRVDFTLAAFSKDIQAVDVVGSINFSINKSTAMELYKTVGTGYVKTLVMPRIAENLKVIFSRYTAEELITNRSILSDEVFELMHTDLEDKGINIISISISDIDFTDAFTDAIEAKQVATQDKLRAETEQERKTLEAQAEADRKVIEAQADAEVKKTEADANAYKIKTQAEAEAEANEKINKSLTEQLIDYTYANRWNGSYPTVMGSDSTIIPINGFGN